MVERRAGFRLRFPQGGSTLTQQLVRGYFLHDLTEPRERRRALPRRPDPAAPLRGPGRARPRTSCCGSWRRCAWRSGSRRRCARRYGSQERAKREIFARYASFIYLGNGRYGFAAGSEYYFGKPLSSYTPEDAGKAALLAGITKSPRDYAPVPGDPRPLRRRNEILALMARNGYIPEDLAKRCQAEPVRVAARSPVKTQAPAAIEHVFDELKQHGGGRFGVEDLFQGRISVRSTVDERVQTIVNEALENGLALYEKRHPEAKGLIQGSVVVLRNADAAILAEAGGRQVYKDRSTRYSDFNRVTGSLRQPGSAWKPLRVPGRVPPGPRPRHHGARRAHRGAHGRRRRREVDRQLRQPVQGPDPDAPGAGRVPQRGGRLARPRDRRGQSDRDRPRAGDPHAAAALHHARRSARRRCGCSSWRAPIAPWPRGSWRSPTSSSACTDASGGVALRGARDRVREIELRRPEPDPGGAARRGPPPERHRPRLDGRDFPIPVMGKTGTTSDFRDALFVGSTYGRTGITVAVRIGFDDNRALGDKETGGRAALPIFREIMLRVYSDKLVGPVPEFPPAIEEGIDEYLARRAARKAGGEKPPRPAVDSGLGSPPPAASVGGLRRAPAPFPPRSL